jgi:hypothetical protein
VASFVRARFTGGVSTFARSRFAGFVQFGGAEFSGGTAFFGDMEFSRGRVNFNGAKFCGADVGFDNTVFSGALVTFHKAIFLEIKAISRERGFPVARSTLTARSSPVARSTSAVLPNGYPRRHFPGVTSCRHALSCPMLVSNLRYNCSRGGWRDAVGDSDRTGPNWTALSKVPRLPRKRLRSSRRSIFRANHPSRFCTTSAIRGAIWITAEQLGMSHHH